VLLHRVELPQSNRGDHERRARSEHVNWLSQHYGFLAIEDDPYCELYYSAVPPNEHAGDLELAIQLRSASKMLAPGLPIGVLSGPQWLTQLIITARQSIDLHTSSLTQAVVAEALVARWLDAHLDGACQSYSAKRNKSIAGLRSSFGACVGVDTPIGGMFLWRPVP
jgi:2-aminoadipate transaminase